MSDPLSRNVPPGDLASFPVVSFTPTSERVSHQPPTSPESTRTKLAGPIYTGKRELIGFSVHNVANTFTDCTGRSKLFFLHRSSTGLSVLWSAGGEVQCVLRGRVQAPCYR